MSESDQEFLKVVNIVQEESLKIKNSKQKMKLEYNSL